MVTDVAVEINKVEGVASTVHLSSQSPGCRETRERGGRELHIHIRHKKVYIFVVCWKTSLVHHTIPQTYYTVAYEKLSVLYICMLGSGCLCVYCAVLG